jgi:hypothetical protein
VTQIRKEIVNNFFLLGRGPSQMGVRTRNGFVEWETLETIVLKTMYFNLQQRPKEKKAYPIL